MLRYAAMGISLGMLTFVSQGLCGVSLAPTVSIGQIKNQTGYLKTEMQTVAALGLRTRYRLEFLQAGAQLELGSFDGEPASSAALDAGASLPLGSLPIGGVPVRLDLRGGMTYNGYKFTHWYWTTSLAEEFNHFLSPLAGGDVEIGRWSVGGEYLFGSHLIWRARIGFRVFGSG